MAVQQNIAVGGPRHKPFRHGSGYLMVLSGVGLVLVAVLAALSSPLGRQVALAGGGADNDREVIFTKWITSVGTPPVLFNMGGVVSGAVGGGQFVGEILDLENTAATTKIKALYHVNGGIHQFSADVHVTQDNVKGTGTIQGVVTDGWLKGARVEGRYQVISPCGIINAQQGPFGDVCFQGILHLLRDS